MLDNGRFVIYISRAGRLEQFQNCLSDVAKLAKSFDHHSRKSWRLSLLKTNVENALMSNAPGQALPMCVGVQLSQGVVFRSAAHTPLDFANCFVELLGGDQHLG